MLFIKILKSNRIKKINIAKFCPSIFSNQNFKKNFLFPYLMLILLKEYHIFLRNRTKFKIEDILNNIPNDYIWTLNEEISLQKNKLIDDSEDWLKIDLDDKNFDDYLEMYSNGNVNSTYDFKLISDAFNKFLDLKKPKSTQSNVDFKNISNSDEELIDFDVNLIE